MIRREGTASDQRPAQAASPAAWHSRAERLVRGRLGRRTVAADVGAHAAAAASSQYGAQRSRRLAQLLRVGDGAHRAARLVREAPGGHSDALRAPLEHGREGQSAQRPAPPRAQLLGQERRRARRRLLLLRRWRFPRHSRASARHQGVR